MKSVSLTRQLVRPAFGADSSSFRDDADTDDLDPVAASAAHCVDCRTPLGDGLMGISFGKAHYGPPAPDWRVRCADCYAKDSGGHDMAYQPEYPRPDKQELQRRQAERIRVSGYVGDRRVAAQETHEQRQYDYPRYYQHAFPRKGR